jgi:tetrahydromethanopterin S-methyltransferase subunit C
MVPAVRRSARISATRASGVIFASIPAICSSVRALAAVRQAQAKYRGARKLGYAGVAFGLDSTSVVFSTAISAVAIGSISPALVQQSIAARIEKLTGQLGAPSSPPTNSRATAWESRTLSGKFSLAGFSAPQLIYDLADSV